MDNANHVLDEFVERVDSTDQGAQLPAPWSSRVLLGDIGQTCAALLVKNEAIGMAGEPGAYRLYAGRKNAGSTLFLIIGGWATTFIALAYAAALWYLASGDGLMDWIGLAAGIFGAVYFSAHLNACWKFPHLFYYAGLPAQYMRFGANFCATAIALGAVIGFSAKTFGWA